MIKFYVKFAQEFGSKACSFPKTFLHWNVFDCIVLRYILTWFEVYMPLSQIEFHKIRISPKYGKEISAIYFVVENGKSKVMEKNSKNLFEEVNSFFESEPTPNQKAWGIINEFYSLILNYMERNNISKSELARRLGKSRAAVSQMFNNSPNVSIRKLVEIADAIGFEIVLQPRFVETESDIYAKENGSHVTTLSERKDKRANESILQELEG